MSRSRDYLDSRHRVDPLALDGRAPRRRRQTFASLRKLVLAAASVVGAALWIVGDVVARVTHLSVRTELLLVGILLLLLLAPSGGTWILDRWRTARAESYL